MGTIVIRPALPDEYEAVGRIVVAAYRTLDDPPSEGYEAHMADVAGRASVSTVLAAVLDGRLVGTATLVFPGSPLDEIGDPDGAGIRMLGVDPACRGRGVGEALVRACVQRARDGGAARIWLHTETCMTDAHRLYARCGFVREPARDWTPVPDVDLLAYVLDLASTPGA